MTSQLPSPNGSQSDWNPYSAKVVAGLVFVGAFGLFFAFLSTHAVVEARWPYLLFYVPAAVVFLLPPLMIRRMHSRVDVPTIQEFTAEHGAGQFRLARSLEATIGVVSLAVVAVIGCATFSVGVWSGALEFDLTRRQQGSFPILLAMFGLFCAWIAVGTSLRGTSGWLALSPSEIESMEWGLGRRRIAWDDIAGLTQEPQQRTKRYRVYSPSRLWLLPTDPGKRPTSISINWPMGNRAAYWLIHFYWSHPELRDELADDRVIERLAHGRIVDEVV